MKLIMLQMPAKLNMNLLCPRNIKCMNIHLKYQYLMIKSQNTLEHFQLRTVPIPDELLNPREYAYLQDQHFVVNEDPPSEFEIQKACEKFANGKSCGTDRVPMESLKYHQSDRLLAALLLLLTTIWSLVTVPTNWLSLSITCLYKKGLKSLPSNYRPLTVGSNISRILPSIIISRLQDSYEHNISDSQFGFRKGRSTCDANFYIKPCYRFTCRHSHCIIH